MTDERKTVEIGDAQLKTLAELSATPPETVSFDDLNEWEGEAAVGTPRDATPTVPRTSTRYDPLTTAVLAATTREDD